MYVGYGKDFPSKFDTILIYFLYNLQHLCRLGITKHAELEDFCRRNYSDPQIQDGMIALDEAEVRLKSWQGYY